MSIPILEFEKFVNENLNKLIVVPTHPLNRENIGKWINRHTDPEIKSIAGIISNLFENVSFEEFLLRLNNIANELRLLVTEEKYEVQMYIPYFDKINKSFTFVSILFYHILKEKNINIKKIVIEESNLNRDENYLTIICDDASYSGSQIYDEIYSLKNNRKIFIVVPYISKIARKSLDYYRNRIIIPEACKTFLSIKNYLNIIINDEKILRKFEILLNEIDIWNKHCLYFDFKLPDSISCTQLILAYGVPLVNSEPTKIETLSLIENCSIYNEIPYTNIGNVNDLQYELGNKMCPFPIYKNIEYTFNGKQIYSLDKLLLL